MMLKDALAAQGQWLFRWRGQVPFIFAPVTLWAILESGSVREWIGTTADGLWESGCVILALIGLALRAATVGHAPRGTSGRNTRSQEAASLTTTGMYSLMRHPLYVANFLIFLGMALFPGVGWFAVMAVLAYWLYYERIIMAEEAFLVKEFGETYQQWTQHTPALVPRLKNWRSPRCAFSLRTVLRREYSGLFAIVTVFSMMEMGELFVLRQPIEAYAEAVAWMTAGCIVFVTLRALKRHTHLLHVEGR